MNNRRLLTHHVFWRSSSAARKALLICGTALISATSTMAFAATPAQNIQNNYIAGLKAMTSELISASMASLALIGTFFDADQAQDTQLAYKQLQAEANKDYHPSETMCQFGTFVRSVARTERKAGEDKLVLNDILTSTDLGEEGTSRSLGAQAHFSTRLEQFKTIYCNPSDHNGQLSAMCTHDAGTGADDLNRVNKDIDYMRTVGSHLTVNVNTIADPTARDDEQDIHALARNLYPSPPTATITNSGALREIREYLAMKNIAQNSYVNIVASKSSADEGNGETSGWNFMKAMMRDFGLSDEDIHAALGDYPSYHAQMDVLAKKMYQSPDFYTNLYDKPTNVERISASMESIRLMQLRDQYQSALRREMLLSALLSNEVRKPLRDSLAVLDTN